MGIPLPFTFQIKFCLENNITYKTLAVLEPRLRIICLDFPVPSGAPCVLASLFTSVQHCLEILVHYLVTLSYKPVQYRLHSWMIFSNLRLTIDRGRMWPKVPDICLAVEGKPWKNFNQEIDPTGDPTGAHCERSNDVTPRPAGSMGAAPKLCSEHGSRLEVNGSTRISSVAEFKTQVAFYFIHCFLLAKKMLVIKHCHNLTQG